MTPETHVRHLSQLVCELQNELLAERAQNGKLREQIRRHAIRPRRSPAGPQQLAEILSAPRSDLRS
jgi:hypothetical protein